VRTTYGFKNAGRKKNADPSRKGSALMPGLYKHKTCVDQLETQQKTYSFKACDRYHTPTALVGYIDKVCTHNLIECKLLCCLIVCNLFKPRATGGNIVGQHYSQHCWVLHVVSICTPCCMLLGVVAQNKRVKRLSQQLPTFLLLHDRQSVAQQCSICLHSSSNVVGATHMHHHTWSPKSYGLYPSHDTPHVPTLLGVNVASVCKQLPTWMQQLPTLLAQQCLDFLRPCACSFKVKNITSLIFFQILLKAMIFLSSVLNISFFTRGFHNIFYVLFGKKIGRRRSSFVDFSFLFMIKSCNKLKINSLTFQALARAKICFYYICIST